MQLEERISRIIYKMLRSIIWRWGLQRYELVRKLARPYRNYFYGRFYRDHIDVFGHKVYLDPNDSMYLFINEIYEPYETELISSIIKPGTVVLDIGANIGYHTLLFAKLVGQSGKVFAFEPSPANFRLLEKNVSVNGYSNVILEQKAVSNRNEKKKLYLNENAMMHTIYKSHASLDSVEIDTISLDNYFRNYGGKIDFIKMDIEGSEITALEGMQTILQRQNDIKLLVAFNPSAILKYGYKPEQQIDLLVSNGFTVYFANSRTKDLELVNPGDVQYLIKMTPKDGGKEELSLLCKKE
jgi:FkbM family methyltransferase